jgi:hypothetical protein
MSICSIICHVSRPKVLSFASTNALPDPRKRSSGPAICRWAPLWVAFLLFTTVSSAANITAANSGLWAVASTWVGGAVPGNGDTANIPDGLRVTVNDTRTIGTSGPNLTVAVTLNNSGQLLISQGGVLIARGDIVYTPAGCGNTGQAVIMQGGSTLEFDSSASAAPSATRYTFGPTGPAGCRIFYSGGTAQLRNNIRSNPAGGAGMFSMRGTTGNGGSFIASYTDFLRIGDSSNPGWQIAYEYSGNHYIQWDVTNSTFTNCGTIASTNYVGIDDSGTFRHSYNVHSTSASPEIFTQWITITNPGNGLREIRNNVFDVSMTRSQFYMGGFNVWSNYFADATATGGSIAWKSFQGNIIRYTNWWAQQNRMTSVLGDLRDNYIFVDSDGGNPKPIIMNSAIQSNLQAVIFGQAGNGMAGVNDSGELWYNYNPTNPGTQYGIYNSIVLPNMAGHGSLELGSITAAFLNLVAVAEHNTWFGGQAGITQQGVWGFPAIQLGEGGNGAAGMVGSFRSNIIWNPQLQVDSTGAAHDYRSSFFKLADLSNSPTPIVDYCTPANCDYNTGYGHTLTDTAKPQYTFQTKGYAARFSAPPGDHDVDVDPQFVDFQRTLELFDSKYLGYKPSTWSSSVTYKTGDFVSWSRPDVYWSLSVNYRYMNAGQCAGANPEPGAGLNWRDCWEWASLYHIREAIAVKKTVDDQPIGAHGDDMIMTLLSWIRAGYSPTNTSLAGAAHDGTDIGAVPVSFPAPTAMNVPHSTGNTLAFGHFTQGGF